MVNSDLKIQEATLTRYRTSLFSSGGIVMLFLPVLFYSQNQWVSQIGSLCLILCYLIIVYDTLKRTITLPINTHTIIFLILLVWSLLSWSLSMNANGLYNLVLCAGGLFVIYFFSNLEISIKEIKRISSFALILLALLIPLAINMGLHGGISEYLGYEPYFNRVIFKLMLPLSFFIALIVKRKYLVWISVIAVYFIMIERTSAMALSFVFLSYYVFPFIKGQSDRIKWIFFSIIIGLFLFNAVYLWLYSTSLGSALNEQISEATSKNLFTGRQIIWKAVIEEFSNKPILGHGFDPDVLIQRNVTLSTHNAYFYMLLHTGISGLVFFLAYLYSYWRYLCENWNEYSRLTLSYMVALLVFLNFELTIVANTMVLGLFYSLAIGVGIALSGKNDINISKRSIRELK